jgi:calcineurin-like phosphoesterase family protein
MGVYFSSDLHIRHKLVAKLRADMVGVAFASDDETVAWHDHYLATRWDALVKSDDQVWVLGDISGGGKGSQLNALEWIARRPGEKHLVPGNHDGIHPSSRDSHKWFPEYLQVFSSVQPFARRKIAGRSVLLSHFPYEGEGERGGGDRFTQYRLRDEGLPVLHGHIHSTVKTSRVAERGGEDWMAGTLQLHVGLDAWNLAPVHLDELAELLG